MTDQNPPQKQSPSPEGGPTPRGAIQPWPADLPPEALTMVVAALRGQAPDPWEAWRCTWHVVGFASGRLDTHPRPVFKGAAPAMSREDAARELEKLARPLAGDTPGARAAAIPWQVILPLLFDLAKNLLQQWLGG